MWQISAVPILVIASVVCFAWLFVFPSRTSFISVLSVSITALAVLLWFAWFFRDGMGPAAVTTTGLKALQHFWCGAAIPMVAWFTLAFVATIRFWWWLRQQPHNSFKPSPLQGSAQLRG